MNLQIVVLNERVRDLFDISCNIIYCIVSEHE